MKAVYDFDDVCHAHDSLEPGFDRQVQLAAEHAPYCGRVDQPPAYTGGYASVTFFLGDDVIELEGDFTRLTKALRSALEILDDCAEMYREEAKIAAANDRGGMAVFRDSLASTTARNVTGALIEARQAGQADMVATLERVFTEKVGPLAPAIQEIP